MKHAFLTRFHINIISWGLVFVTPATQLSFGAELPLDPLSKSRTPNSVNITSSPFVRENALSDPQNRISKDFHVPKGLEDRTAFWFDVYTKYGSQEHIVHHTLYPWIVYKVVDTRPINDRPLHKWTKYHKARKQVRTEVSQVRAALTQLARRGLHKKSSELEKQVANALRSVPGKRSHVYRVAAKNMRVQLGQKDFIRAGLAYSEKYLPYMEATFLEKGLPTELTRLPFVESSFNVLAESKVGASGIWQIMPVTGKQYLIVNQHIDERNSPLKATLAAAEILKSNFRTLKAWPLAVTAYNHGPTGIRRALKAAHADNLTSLINKYYAGNFQFASANFYTSFLAVLHAEKYHNEIFIDDPINDHKPLLHTVVSLDKKMRFRDLAKKLRLSRDVLLALNLDLRDAAKSNAFIPRGYNVVMPADHAVIGAKEKGLPFREASLSLKKSKTSGS
jgi:membrane-bound lytic murein transglycosylase D